MLIIIICLGSCPAVGYNRLINWLKRCLIKDPFHTAWLTKLQWSYPFSRTISLSWYFNWLNHLNYLNFLLFVSQILKGCTWIFASHYSFVRVRYVFQFHIKFAFCQVRNHCKIIVYAMLKAHNTISEHMKNALMISKARNYSCWELLARFSAGSIWLTSEWVFK